MRKLLTDEILPHQFNSDPKAVTSVQDFKAFLFMNSVPILKAEN